MVQKRAILYARVSSDDRSNEGRNLEGQIEMCRQHALSKGWRIIAELAEDDRGASGAKLDLPKLNQVLDLAQQGEFDVLVVRELDRLSRSLPKQLFIEDILRRSGVQVEYVLGEYPDTPEGNFLKNVRAAVAELERLKINERTVRGRVQAVKSGSVLVYNRPPYGYDLVEVDGKYKLVVREDEARIVRLVFEWYIKGDGDGNPVSLAEIARRLTAMGIPTYTDSRDRGQTIQRVTRHGRWHKATIQKMLKKTDYIGRWSFGKWRWVGNRRVAVPADKQISTAVPAIIDEETWHAAQRKLETNLQTARRNRKHSYLLAGHISCGSCSARVFGRYVKRETQEYHYYSCGARTYPDKYRHSCNAPYFRGEPIDEAVWTWIKSLLTNPEILEIGLRTQQASWHERNVPLRDQLTQIEEQIGIYQGQQERLLDLYLNSKITMPVWEERNSALQEKLHHLAQERALLASKLQERHITDQQIQDIQAFAQRILESITLVDEDFTLKRRLVEMLNIQVALCSDEQGGKYAQVTCMLGNDDLSVASMSTHPTRR